MSKEYSYKEIELNVQKHWKKNKTFSVIEKYKKKKYYCLPMLPYPSGDLHMGHVRNYTISDIIARFQRMNGKNVLHPIGWDAFGLPAEETAIKNNISPKKWTFLNIKIMKKQLKSLGLSYDWNREIVTCLPEYYKWEQYFFIKLYKKNIIYKKKTLVNWCNNDKTVLANEQVQNGVCWRCGTPIIIKKKSQWFLKIKSYAEKLLNDLKLLKDWPKDVIQMQKNWIGKSKGIEIICKIYLNKEKLKIFTTKPENIMGITFFAISIHHPITKKICNNNINIKKFLKKYKNKPLKYFQGSSKKIGINTNILIIHPITKKKIPLWIANYIKHDYATGAIMGVPGHNKKDAEFAQKYNISKKIIFSLKKINLIYQNKIYQEIKSINSNSLNGLNKLEISYIIKKKLVNKNQAKLCIHYNLQDWSISRQRYWGVPIPMTKNSDNKIIPIPKKQLPVNLPKSSHKYNLYNSFIKNKKWAFTYIDNKKVQRDPDTLDTFIQSSWYYARYTNPNYKKDIIDIKSSQYWLPVDIYIGGIEHAVMHLIYFRFYHKLLKEFGYVESKEPVKKLLCQGMVIIDSFYILNKNNTKTWIPHSKLKIIYNKEGKILHAIKKDTGKIVKYAGKIKMSKSKKNGISPSSIIKKYGADSLRLFIIFAAPIESSLEWNYSGIIGMHRFLKKLWNFVQKINFLDIKNISSKKIEHEEKLLEILYNTIKKITKDIKYRYSFNTAISHIIKFFYKLKEFYKTKEYSTIFKKCMKNLIKMLYPFSPHISFILFKKIVGNTADIDHTSWPIAKKLYFFNKIYKLIIQINGKKRHILELSKKYNKKNIIKKIIINKKLNKYFKNKKIQKTIYIPEKIINFVIL